MQHVNTTLAADAVSGAPLLQRCCLLATLFCILALWGGSPARAAPLEGIQLGAMRVVYPEKNNNTLFSLTNTSQDSYLMQSWVRLPQGEEKAPFIVLPPLKRLGPKEKLDLRILRTGGDLPDDRESLFYLTMKAIPSHSEKQADGKMTLVLQNSVKLFYRPQALPPGGVKMVGNSLVFKRNGTELTATNPSSYYLTFAELLVGEHELGKDQLHLMVPPKSSQSWQIPASAHGEVRWRLIDETGQPTPQLHQAALR